VELTWDSAPGGQFGNLSCSFVENELLAWLNIGYKGSGICFGSIPVSYMHEQSIVECVEAWRSHATLERQAGAAFGQVVSDIEAYLLGLKTPTIQIPYATNVWVAQLR